MDTAVTVATWIGLWGGLVSTSLAFMQFVKWRRERPRLVVSAALSFASASDGEDPYEHLGTPVVVQQGRDVMNQRALVTITVANHGEKALQVVGVLVEDANISGTISTTQVVPSPLPAVVEPRSSVSVLLQKEFLDMSSQITFFGVVDALGRRHPVTKSEAKSVVERAWQLPTRAAWFQRRDDPGAEPVRAFQSKQPSNLTTRPKMGSDRPIASRPVAERGSNDPRAEGATQ